MKLVLRTMFTLMLTAVLATSVMADDEAKKKKGKGKKGRGMREEQFPAPDGRRADCVFINAERRHADSHHGSWDSQGSSCDFSSGRSSKHGLGSDRDALLVHC